MNPGPTLPPVDGTPPGRIRVSAVVIVAAVCAAYLNSLGVPFLFDDVPSILENPAVRSWSAFLESLQPGTEGGLTTSGRPVLALGFLLNHAVGGYGLGGFHAVNAAIHAAAALCLFGLVRRTLCRPALRARFGAAALPLAAAVALIWALHPLQTAAVTYVVQRAESLAALFVLGVLYAFARAAASKDGAARGWRAASVAACALGLATKETAAAAPLLVLLYDRAFVGGSFRAAWSARRGYYSVLFATWLLLFWLVAGTAGRGGTAGFAADVPIWSYALTQCRALVSYVGLAAWPHPLVFDYGRDLAGGLGEVLPQALAIAAVLGGVAAALVRRPAAGFLGAGFLLLLAPSSSFVPVATQTMAEHRFYLPLAAPVAGAILFFHGVVGRRAWAVAGCIAAALLAATVARNSDYRSEVSIWADAAAKLPTNARAHNNLGQALFRAGDAARALACYDLALALQPEYPETHYNRGVALARLGRPGEAVAAYGAALRRDPRYAEAHNNLGNALAATGRLAEAIASYEAALDVRPGFPEAHNNLGNALLQSGRAEEAAERFRRALALKPGDAEAGFNLGNARAAAGEIAEALRHYEWAVAVRPGYAAAHVNAGNALLELGRPVEAESHYERAVSSDPRLADARFNLASVYLDRGRWAEAVAHLETALQIDPEFVRAHRALGFALARLGRSREAAGHYDRYLRAAPGDAEARAERADLGRSLPR